MDISHYLKTLKNAQNALLAFIDNDESKGNFEQLKKFLIDQKIIESRENLKGFIHMIFEISNNHQRTPTLFSQIEQILIFIKDKIIQTFSNREIFNFFKHNKRILLFLIEEKIMVIDEHIALEMSKSRDFESFFLPEISFAFCETSEKNDTFSEFQAKRKNGENESYICQLIRNDSIKEFIEYVSRVNLKLDSEIKATIFETNSFLLKQTKTNLIEYAAFFGSIQIFQYLKMNDVELKPSLWLYAIHSQNEQIIHLLEENHVDPPQKTYKECIAESIKCHHIKIANYLKENLYEESEKDKDYFDKIAVESHNYLLFPSEFNCQFIFGYLCLYDYPILVDHYLKTKDININKTTISFCYLFCFSTIICLKYSPKL